jgi:type I restriction enzyme S subunit
MSEAAVPKGYKQTEVGVIPEDWGYVRLNTVAKLESGHTPSRRQPKYWNGGTPWVSLHDTDALNDREISHTAQTVTKEGIANSSARILPKGTVVFSRTATVGKATVLGREMATSQDFANYICGPRVHNHFLVYLFRSMSSEWGKLMAGSIHNTIYMPAFKILRVVLPPITEQEAIAEAMSDADALIESLEQLIAKKRHIKQGAMQELLTGKKRLPGFGGEWEVKSFGDVFDYHSTATNSRSDLSESGDAYYIHYGDIHTRFHSHLDFRDEHPAKIERSKCHNASLLKNGDWVMADASEDFDGVGKSIEILGLEESTAAVAGLHTFLLREKNPTFVPGFKGHLGGLKSLHDQFLRVATGMKVFGVSKAALRDLLLSVPPLPEQTAIAAILSDMDAEIAALEDKLSKACQLKQGMMQELLTGRIRLI